MMIDKFSPLVNRQLSIHDNLNHKRFYKIIEPKRLSWEKVQPDAKALIGGEENK